MRTHTHNIKINVTLIVITAIVLELVTMYSYGFAFTFSFGKKNAFNWKAYSVCIDCPECGDYVDAMNVCRIWIGSSKMHVSIRSNSKVCLLYL